MSDDIAIKVEHVSKNFVLPHEKITSIKGMFTGLAKKRMKKTVETQHALKDISFEIKKGEFFGIVGRNGSGKSTMLKILATIYQPSNGKISVRGKLVPFIELGVGFNPELTGRENVYLNGAMLGFSQKEIDGMYENIVEFAELERFMDQKLKNYSSGMQVRLAFAMATRSEADILLVDEVLAVGDADFQRKCFQYFRGLKKNNKTVVFVSHDMEAIREYCDRCVLIDSSELVYDGSPEVAAEKYTQLFNESAQEIQINDNSERWGDGAAAFDTLDVKLLNDGLRVTATATFKDEMKNPIFGVLIKNGSGATVCGTNNKILGIKLGDKAAGSVQNIQWSIPNIFSEDVYSVEVAITHNDGVTQADWWHNAATFTVRNQHTTPHIVSPKITLELR
jgi:ABC-2 type transport system ATP-binding protein